MKIVDPFLDIFGLVLPQPKQPGDTKPSDNGVYFTSVAVLLGFDFPDYKQKIRDCYIDIGLMARWKDNTFDNCAWDDYLGVAVACIKLGITDIPREILRYGLSHFFVYNTNDKLEFQDFLLRNFPIWPLMFCAAFPSLKYLMYPLLWAVQKTFSKPADLLARNDTSGLQLQWVFLYGCTNLNMVFPSYLDHANIIREAFKIYYHKDHPFNTMLT